MRNEQEFAKRIKEDARREMEEEMRQKLDSATTSGTLDPAVAAEARRIMGFQE